MKLTINPIEAPTIEREVYTRPEYREIKVVIDNASLDRWFQIAGFENKEELVKFVKFAKNGRSCIQAKFRRVGIKLTINTDAKRLVVEMCKTNIPPKEETVAIPTQDTIPANEYPGEVAVQVQ